MYSSGFLRFTALPIQLSYGIERRNVTLRYHGSSISESSHLSWRRRPFGLSNDESMGYRCAPGCYHVIHVNIVLSAIFGGPRSFCDPDILLPNVKKRLLLSIRICQIKRSYRCLNLYWIFSSDSLAERKTGKPFKWTDDKNVWLPFKICRR